MNVRTALSLADGRSIDLVNPTMAQYAPLGWAAEHLAKEPRYNGATPGAFYSVAQHLVEGAAAILELTHDRVLAAYFALHDVHEAALKDDTTPKKRAIAAIAEEHFGVLAPGVLAAFAELTDRHDRAIHAAAGLPWPPDPRVAKAVEYFDRVMLVTEWCDFMPGIALPNAEAYSGYAPLSKSLRPWMNWEYARDQLLRLWLDLLPADRVVLR
jgi:hypothetical protein